ncbi:hypothetical protein IMZ31_21935 (plasmid) [Pontibacillus sp. ALD_SL1]|uniref:hypothetical protein n=1 Tax=Pontibacillus sp. ALD_SL1 TaxID=2777185 RepID=UPI001A968898|nr:hypothetical protein [Pontibacillus sp. ALD_SL1]QST02114.1 hypothetical protein IMZ31_21935 [Pontibacillus sp. ALD_SL1]
MKKMIFGGLFVLLLMIPSMFWIDMERARNDKAPVFVVQTALYKDGGTKKYIGIGYTVTHYKQMEGRRDVVFKPFWE